MPDHRLACGRTSPRMCRVQPQLPHVRERGFLRVLVQHDYHAAKANICAQQALVLHSSPDSGLVTIFDYTGGPVHVTTHAIGADLPRALAVSDEEWEDSVARAARSGGRLALHLVRVVMGKSPRTLVVPLRRSHADLDGLVRQMSNEIMPTDQTQFSAFSAKFREQIERLDRDVVEN
ncbi:hypothetical protein C8J57DRAFT_1288587, partial [Mycena rebaudengoi]